MAFDFATGNLPASDDIAHLFESTFAELARPGNRWTGAEKVAIAAATREAMQTRDLPRSGPGGTANHVIGRSVNDPATATKEWVEETVKSLGMVGYVELVGWASMTVAIDTYTALRGFRPEPLPQPEPGAVEEVGHVEQLRMRSAWVPMAGPHTPRMTLSAVPRTQRAMNAILDRLYTRHRRDSRRGVAPLTASQVELVATATSHGNRCFYCSLGHLTMLLEVAKAEHVEIEPLGIADPAIDTRVPGGQSLIALSRAAVTSGDRAGIIEKLVEQVGSEGAACAVEVASAFMMVNRLIEMTGQPTRKWAAESMGSIVAQLGLHEFPHSGHRERGSLVAWAKRRLRRPIRAGRQRLRMSGPRS